MHLLYFISLVSIAALVFAGALALGIRKKDRGSEKAREMSDHIREGARTFMGQELKYLAVVVVLIAIVLVYFVGPSTAFTFAIGAFLSSLAGVIGMSTATGSNSRTSEAVKGSLGEGLRVAFSSGTVMGMSVVGFGLLGIVGLYMLFPEPGILFGFAFGASTVALFARVGGGIYTKTADIGADLVGKIEENIPEDDPRNPGVVADNVGDNVGDVAAMGADLFESYAEAIIATMAIGVLTIEATGAVLLPVFVGAAGIAASIIGYFLVGGEDNLHWALNRGTFSASALSVLFIFLGMEYLFPNIGIGVFYSVVFGLLAGIVIGLVTEYYTASEHKPTREIAEESTGGAATNIIAGLSTGMMSTLVPMLTVCAAMVLSYHFAGLYGIGIASVGMLSTLGITLATDCYGPVADNAGGIAEMAGMGEKVRKRAEALDSIGNTTAAMGKGFAIGSAALASLTLFVAYTQEVGLESVDVALTDPMIVTGLFIGALLPFVFSALTMRSVGKSASIMIDEIRRQFEEMDILSGEEKPDYSRCIQISTDSALREMVIPGALAILSPIVVGLVLGTDALAGMLAGNISTGFLLAVTMANAGGAWDNAKKYIEEGNLGGKGSEAHKASVVGDTVGDPMKDTSGPSLNVLIKLVAMTALIFIPLLI